MTFSQFVLSILARRRQDWSGTLPRGLLHGSAGLVNGDETSEPPNESAQRPIIGNEGYSDDGDIFAHPENGIDEGDSGFGAGGAVQISSLRGQAAGGI